MKKELYPTAAHLEFREWLSRAIGKAWIRDRIAKQGQYEGEGR